VADLRVCVIGTGAMGADHIIRINTRMSGAVVTAIVEPDAKRAAEALKCAPDAKHF
jgi:myo-inositol 2-dehydrogenase / D-chiro-inositol 1-dehydrogenase